MEKISNLNKYQIEYELVDVPGRYGIEFDYKPNNIAYKFGNITSIYANPYIRIFPIYRYWKIIDIPIFI